MITGSLEGYIDRIVTFTGADFGFSGTAAGVGNSIIVLGAVNGNTGIALCLHKTVDGEIQSSHDQFKILGCIDLNISVHSGNAFTLGSYRCLVDDLTLCRCCIGVFRQDVEFKTVVQIICHITCRIYNNIAVIFTGTNHDGDVFAVRGSSGKCFLNSLIDGIVRGCLSGSDKGIIRCILRSIVVLSLQSTELFLSQFFLNFLGRGDAFGCTLDHDLIGHRNCIRLGNIEFGYCRRAGTLGVVSALAAGTRLLIFFIGRMEALMCYAGIVENLSLNHNREIIHKGQIFLIFSVLQQIIQGIDFLHGCGVICRRFFGTAFGRYLRCSFSGLLKHDIFHNDSRTVCRCRFHLSNILCFGDYILIPFLLRSDRHRQIDAQHAQAKNKCHDLCKFSFKAF